MVQAVWQKIITPSKCFHRNPRSSNSNFTLNNNNKKCKLFEIYNIIDYNTSTIPNFDYSLPCLIQVHGEKVLSHFDLSNNYVEEVQSKVLFVTGALHGNYINLLKFAKSLSKLGININYRLISFRWMLWYCWSIVVDLNIKFLNKNEKCCCL